MRIPIKMSNFFSRLFFEFAHKNKGFRLILVGRDDFFYKELRRSVSSTSVSFLDNVTDSDLGYLYSWAEGFVSSSLMEGFGLPALEAMANGCPVILSDIPSFKEVCVDNAVYFNPYQNESLYQALKKITTESKKQREMRIASGILRSQQFSWRKTAEETMKAYESSISL